MKRTVLTLALASVLAGSGSAASLAQTTPAPAPAAARLTAAQHAEVVEGLAREIEDYFVFPDLAKRYAAAIRERLAQGAYAALTDPSDFAKALTGDLQAVQREGHLRVRAPADPEPVRAAPRPGMKAIERADWIAPGVAYISFNIFPRDEETARAARRFLLDHADARVLIIDCRENKGGTAEVMNAMLPLLYGERTQLLRMDTRAAAAGDLQPPAHTVAVEAPTGVVRRDHVVEPDPDEHRLRDVKIYFLTSARTASAAEHLALALKRTRRALLIGETTRGAGHYGGFVPVGAGFSAFIPVGRTYDPDTGQGWEGVGVEPDVRVPADQALDRALELARAS